MLRTEREVGLRATVDTVGRPLLPAFTSERELVAWFTEGSHWIELAGHEALQLFLSSDCDRIVVDPASDFPPVLTRQEAGELLGESKS